MKLLKLSGLIAVISLGLVVPASAGASGEIPATSFTLAPKSGSFYTDAFKSANWATATSVSAPNPPNVKIRPTRSTTLKMPPNTQMTFNPGSMPVCPDSAIGPTTNNSAPIPTIVAKCPDSIIGNGTATFLLAGNNRPENPSTQLIGQVIVFNGGTVDGQARLKFWAYSYDTNVAIYTESVLSTAGILEIPIPQLTQDSAVNRLDVEIPGKTQKIFLENQGIEITLPGGQAPNYVQAKCTDGVFPYSADFLLGARDTSGQPVGPQELFPDVGDDVPCTGVPAAAKLGKLTVKGPSTAKVGKTVTYSVTIPNTGGATATGVRLKVAGRGVSVNSSVGSIAGESSKTVKIKAKFKNKGKIKATFTASSSNAGTQKATKTITVK